MSPGSDESSRGFSWYSPAGSDKCFVEISLSADMSNAVRFEGTYITAPNGERANKAFVSGLEKGKTYYYRCYAGSEKTDVYSFTTLPDDDFSFVYVTDIHVSYLSDDEKSVSNGAYNLNSAIEAAQDRKNISLVVSGGDQASSALRSEYDGVSAPFAFKSVAFASSVGNHDRKNIWYRYFKNVPNENKRFITSSYAGSDYWFVKGDALFLMLDTNNVSAADHRNFIKAAVAKNPDVKWRIAVFHHDLYGGRIEHRESENKLLRLILTPIFDEFAIDLVLTGHSHYYSVSNVVFDNATVLSTADVDSVTDAAGTVYMTSGSINRPRNDEEEPPLGENVGKSYLTDEMIYNIIDVSENSLKINSYTVESGSCFESFTLSKTSQTGGHKKAAPGFVDTLLRGISVIVGVFNNLGNRYDFVEEHGIGVLFN